MKIKLIILITLFLTSMLGASTIYEDGHGFYNWKVSDNRPSGATVNTVTEHRNSVIEFNGIGIKNAFLLGDKRDSNRAWESYDNRYIAWSMKFSSSFKISIFVNTTRGKRVLYYDNRQGQGKRRKKIHYGLGSEISNGEWQTIIRDIETDIKRFEPNNELVTIYGIEVRGNGKIDNVIGYTSSFNIDSGLIAHYEFENNTNDSSGNGNHGTKYGGGLYVDGVINKAMTFDGVGNSSYVTIPQSAFNKYVGTVGMWIKPNKLSTGGLWTFYNGDDNRLRFEILQNQLRVMVDKNTSILSANLIEQNTSKWSHVSFTYDFIHGLYQIYQNGQLLDITLDNSNPMNNVPSYGYIGIVKDYDDDDNDSNDLDYGFDGIIDDVRIYNKALDEIEIFQLYNISKHAVNLSKGLIGYYKFENNANDSSGNLSHGIEYNTAYANGKVDKALRLNGIGNDSYVTIPQSAFNKYSGTVGMWIKPNKLSTGGLWTFYNGDNNRLRFEILQNQLRDMVDKNTSILSANLIDQNRGKWSHVSFSYDFTNDIYQIYQNGQLLNTTFNNYNPMNNVPPYGYIGIVKDYDDDDNDGDDLDYGFNGMIDDVRLYNRALNNIEIKALYELNK